MVDSDDNNICSKFWNFTMRLFHLLGFTEKLVFGSSTPMIWLNLFFVCFIDVPRLLKEPAEIDCHAFL